jgi:hypothetical protein
MVKDVMLVSAYSEIQVLLRSVTMLNHQNTPPKS